MPPPEYAADLDPPGWRGSRTQHYPAEFQIALLICGAAAAVFAVHLARKVPRTGPALATLVLMAGALAAQLLLYYHVAALLGVLGLVIAYRATGPVVLRRFWIFSLACASIALIQVSFLAARPGSVMQLVGAIVGQPSVWPYVRLAEFSLGAAVLVMGALAHGLWRIASRRRAPDYSLLALLGVGIPLFMLGLFSWNMPSRYTSASLLPMLLCAFAFAQHCVDYLARRFSIASRAAPIAAAVAIVALLINPPVLAAWVSSGEPPYPDHKGAAAVRPRPAPAAAGHHPGRGRDRADLLPRSRRLLADRPQARKPLRPARRGEIRDFYTGTPVIDDGEQLRRVLSRAGDRQVIIIGSGEQQSDRRRGARGPGISSVLASDLVETIYVGRDGLTKVWRARPPAPAQRASRG